MLQQLTDVIRTTNTPIDFTILEIGALQLSKQPERFYQLLDLYPGSQIISFEVDETVCAEMNSNALAGVRYYPIALGQRNERRPFYITQHPMCCSLYKPNEPLISLYNNFEVAYLKSITEIDTVSLDSFAKSHDIGAIDFIKIDIQGGELDVFRGGEHTLREVLAIVCEVEFIPHYIDQPLFGDVCAYLDQHGLMFHKFLGLAGRALKPIVLNNNPNLPSQHIWSDAVFTRHVQSIENLAGQQLLKLSVLAGLYGSPDLAYYCLVKYDLTTGASLASDFMSLIAG